MNKLNPAVAFNKAEIRRTTLQELDKLRTSFTALANNATAENACLAMVLAHTNAAGLVLLAWQLAKAENNQRLLDVLKPYISVVNLSAPLAEVEGDPPSDAA